MSYPEPDPSGPSDRRLFIGLGVTALAVVIAAVVVIVLVTHSHSTGSAASNRTTVPPTATTVTATVTAAHSVSTTASATSSTAQASGAPASPRGGPVPRDFQPESFTAVSDDAWWVLGSAACSSPPCTSIVRSVDGGRSFVGIPAPRTDRVTNLRFADSRDGYAYGTQLWSTHDGGATWTQVSAVPGEVNSLATGDGYVYATGAQGLYRSPVGSDDWTLIHPGSGGDIWVQGDEVFLEDADVNGGPRLLSSANDGSSFASLAGPADTVGCSFVSTGDGVVWAPCATGMLSNVWRSADGGVHWASLDASGGETGNPQPNSASFAAASGQVAVYGADALYRTTDGGARWAAVPDFPPAQTEIAYLGFTDPTHGVAIVDSDAPNRESTATLEITTDGGASYSPVTIPAG